jgi:hypothetical protein
MNCPCECAGARTACGALLTTVHHDRIAVQIDGRRTAQR